ncbi:MAG TPA: M48 family metalloprotease [Candidatus Anoxymicrobiaceae bacterium]
MYEQISANKWKSGLMMAFFFAFVVALGYIIGLALGGTSHPQYALIGLGIAFAIAILMNVFSYYRSDTVALSISGAKPLEAYMNDPSWRHIAMRFDNTVEGLAIAAGVPKPVPYIIYDPAPNAFATGRNPEHSAIAATTGLLTMMNDQELEGVVGHEMSHIKNYDILLQTMTIVLVGTVIMLSDIFLRTFWFGDHDSGGNGEAGMIMMIVAIVFAILAPIIAMLIQLAIGRRREYLADANGALLTRYPPGLASALQKIGGDTHQLRRANKATAHMYIAQPLNRDKEKRGSRLNGLFDTHPPIEDRIRRLDQMTGNFQEVQPGPIPAQ